MYDVPFALQCIYEFSDEGEDGDGEEGSETSGGGKKSLAFCMQMTWFCVVSPRKTRGRWWNVLLRCIEEEI